MRAKHLRRRVRKLAEIGIVHGMVLGSYVMEYTRGDAAALGVRRG